MNDAKANSSTGSGAAPVIRLGTLVVGLLVGTGVGLTIIGKLNKIDLGRVTTTCTNVCSNTSTLLVNELFKKNYLKADTAENVNKALNNKCSEDCIIENSKQQ